MNRLENAVRTLERLLRDDVWRAANPRLGDATYRAVAILREASETTQPEEARTIHDMVEEVEGILEVVRDLLAAATVSIGDDSETARLVAENDAQ